MRIGLLTDLEGQRVWHRWLATDLARSGHSLVILRSASNGRVTYPSSLQIALWLDPILFRLKNGERAFDALMTGRLQDEAEGYASDGEEFDVVIDASSGGRPNCNARRVMRLHFNNEPSELAAVSAVLGSDPVIVTLDGGQGSESETARPAIERRECLSCALDSLYSSVVELLVDRVGLADVRTSQPSHMSALDASHHSRDRQQIAGASYIANVIVQKVSNKLATYLDRRARVKGAWAIATRPCVGKGLIDGPWPSRATYTLLPDDGRRYFADPFLFEHNGHTHLFVEELPLATGRGIISVAEIDERGRAGPFRPVLERDCHLSYPFVFTHAGGIWMIPEASASGSVDLYRAVEYPDRWEHDRTLLSNVPGCDATIIPVAGKYFMVLTSTRWHGSTWDKQRVFFAESPLGPWQEQADGLVRVDLTNARPAGAAILSDGRTLRPAQNSTRFYGSSMTLLDVQQLSENRCQEMPVAAINVVAPAGKFGTHTYSRSRNIEAVDVWGLFETVTEVTLECVPLDSSRLEARAPAAEIASVI